MELKFNDDKLVQTTDMKFPGALLIIGFITYGLKLKLRDAICGGKLQKRWQQGCNPPPQQ